MTARKLPILALMIASLVLLGAIAVWDAQRESAAALDDFAAEQSSLAREASAALASRLAGANDSTARAPGSLLASAALAIEEPGQVIALFGAPGANELVTSAGAPVRAPALERGFASGDRWVRLSREEAASLGLPARMAIAGLAKSGAWEVAVVSSAIRVRDRESRAKWRLVLGLAMCTALIAGFGGLAQRKQKKELELARDLAVAEVMQARNERLVRADKLATLGALATGIAHEVSTPLGVIVGRAEQLLPKVENDERATKSVNAIIEQSERITRIVRAFLRLARGGTPTLEKAEPASLAHEALDLVEHRFATAGVSLTSDVARDLPRVACDPKLFEQVLVNLLLNACDACHENGHVELGVHSRGERVAFTVTDDGEGITEDVAKRATEPFFTTKSESAGTGLGLAIANEIVKHHNGELTLAPNDAAGTRATVELAAIRENDHA